MTIEGISLSFLFDTGAKLSVMSKQVLQSTALPQPLDFYRLRNQAGDVFPDKVVQFFGGHPLTLEGPFVFTVFVCGIELKHFIYTLYLPTTFVAGYDFITAAALLRLLIMSLVAFVLNIQLVVVVTIIFQSHLPRLRRSLIS